MVFLFWLLWIFNFLLLLLAILGKGFRESFGAGVNLNVVIIIGTLIILIAGLILRFGVKQKTISLVVMALPAFTLLIMYIIDKITSPPQ